MATTHRFKLNCNPQILQIFLFCWANLTVCGGDALIKWEPKSHNNIQPFIHSVWIFVTNFRNLMRKNKEGTQGIVQRVSFGKNNGPSPNSPHHERKNCEIVILRQIGSKKPLVSKGRIPTFFYITLSPLAKFGQVLLWKIPLYLSPTPQQWENSSKN